jgi:hypothetical protein
MLKAFLAVLLVVCCGNLFAATNTVFQFALIGDVPYTDFDATNSFPRMISEINAEELAFVVHDGDIKSGGTPCHDEIFLQRLAQFESFKHPFMYVFGDNEWSDCWRHAPYTAEERLARLRELFTKGDESMGQRKLKLQRQSEKQEFALYRENVRWVVGGVHFVGLNVPGADNNYGRAEYRPRNKANLAWLRESFALAQEQNAPAIMIIIQANPGFELSPTNRVRQGFNDFIQTLQTETVAFKKPVVLVHGDTHYFRIDKPLSDPQTKKRLENFTRLETFGYPDVHWVRARVDTEDSHVFSFRAQLVNANKVPLSPFRSLLEPSKP